MKTYQAECIAARGNKLGEGPVWDELRGELFWVDIEGRRLQRLRPSDGRIIDHDVPSKIGCAVPAEDGSWVLGLADGFYRFDPDAAEGALTLLARTDEPNADNRLNDGKCDPAGRFWAGTMSAKWQRDGSLYTLEAGGKLTRKLDEVICSNGLAWSGDRKTLYYIDSAEPIVYAFDYDEASGAISNRRVAIAYPEGQGGPDGMCIDAEGMLWIGHWGGWQVGRWNPLTGEKLATVPIPVRNVTSCAFGGEALDELYITTASAGNSEDELSEQPLAGGLFRIKTDVKGLPADRMRLEPQA